MPGPLRTGPGSETPPSKRVRREGDEATTSPSSSAAAGASTHTMDSTRSVDMVAAAPPAAEASQTSLPTPAPTVAAAAVASTALLCRWEEVLLADTLRLSLDPAVARAKRVLHLGGLEGELREEKKEGGWSLDSRSFFERLLLSRLNDVTSLADIGGVEAGAAAPASSSSSRSSPLAYMIGCYERAVQAGKGPAPRHKGASVGALRDSAVRHLRGVLVTYAILTIQNPDMWGDEDDDAPGGGPISELKNLLRKKGAAALPQGLLDDFIRSTSGDAAGDSGGVTLEELFQPLLLSLVNDAAELSSRADPMAAMGEFASVVQALAALVAWKPLAGLFANLPDWVPEPACSGKSLEQKSPLGILFSFKASRASFEVGTIDLVVCGAEWSRERKATREESQALGGVLKTCRQSLTTVREALVGLLTTLLKAKQAREQVLQWVGAVANHNRGRERDGFHQGFEVLPLSSEGMLGNVLWALLRLCEPFLTAGDPKAEALADKTDLDYFRGSDRIDVSDDTELWSESPEEGGEGDDGAAGGAGVSRWLDQRNQSRIAQFEANRAALLASASSSSSSSPSAGNTPQSTAGAGAAGEEREEEEEKEIDPKSKSFGTTAEFAGLAARLLHVGIGQAYRLFTATNRKMERWRGARDSSKKDLEEGESTLSAHDKRQLEKRVKQCQTRLEEGALTKLMLQLVDMDPDIVLPSLRFLRFQASRLIKHASIGRGITRNAMGEPLPPLPMPPPPRFAMLPAHLMEDVSDMIKFAAYTCPPDSRSGLTPLELITPIEASGILSFLVLFIGTSGYMRNPYIRAKMVEALVAFLPEEDSRGRGRRGKDPFASLFAGHPVACDHLGPQLLEFFVDIELTGSHTQFYDKFTFRSLTAQLLEHLWTLRPYRESIIRYSQDSAKFVRFANMLINDSIYHMDEAVKFLSAIKAAQVRAADQSLSEEDRAAAREEAEHSGRSAKYCLKEAKLLLRMLAYMSESIKDAFMVDELRARIAQMLGYFLDHLVGKKSKDLKVENMAEIGWRPREVLGTLVDVYLSLSACPPFAEAVAGDERSYKREIFLRAADVISKVPSDGSPASEPRVVEAFRAFADKAEAAFVELSQAAEELGDIPDRFMCPIGCDIMRDPVTLPTSGQIMDRPAITRHLLSDSQDPYNRKPLTVEMLEPNDALREEIEEWIRQQRTRSKESKPTSTGEAAVADTSPPPPSSSDGSAPPPSPPPPPVDARSPTAAVGVAAVAPAEASSAMEMSPRGAPPVTGAGADAVAGGSDGLDDDDDDEALMQQALALSLEGVGGPAGGAAPDGDSGGGGSGSMDN